MIGDTVDAIGDAGVRILCSGRGELGKLRPPGRDDALPPPLASFPVFLLRIPGPTRSGRGVVSKALSIGGVVRRCSVLVVPAPLHSDEAVDVLGGSTADAFPLLAEALSRL